MIKKIPTHLIVASTAWASKVVVSLLQIYILKILIEILGVDKYSVFAILTGLMGWFMLFDLGIGSSVQNHISEHRANNKEYLEILNITLFFVIFLSLFFILILYFLSPFLSSIILKIFSNFDLNYKSKLFFITGVCFILTNVGSIVYKILYAQDKGYIANIFPVIGYFISALFIYFLKKNNVPNNLEYALLFFLFPNAILPIIFLFSFLDFKLIFNFKFKKIIPVLNRAFYFWLFALMAVMVLQIDYLVLSQYSNPNDIVIYNLISKIFTIGFFVYNSLLTSIWPVFSFNIAKNNIFLVINYTKKYLKIGIAYIVLFTFLISIFINNIADFFLSNHNLKINLYLVLLFGFYYLLRVWTDTFAMILQSANILKPFLIYVPIQAIISLIFQIILVKKYGLYGVVFGLIISFITTVVWALPKEVNFMIFKKSKI